MSNTLNFPSARVFYNLPSRYFIYSSLEEGSEITMDVNATCTSYGSARRQGTFSFPSIESILPTTSEQVVFSTSGASQVIFNPSRSGLSVAYPKTKSGQATVELLNSFSYVNQVTMTGGLIVPEDLSEDNPRVGSTIPCKVSFIVSSVTRSSFTPQSLGLVYGGRILGSVEEIQDGKRARLSISTNGGGNLEKYSIQAPQLNFSAPRPASIYWDRNTSKWSWTISPSYSYSTTSIIYKTEIDAEIESEWVR